MMKKLLLMLFVSVFAGFQFANAQCSPDPQYADSSAGIYPDSATGLSPAEIGTPYSELVTVVVPEDTTGDVPGVGTITVEVNYFKVDSVKGIPNNFSYVCNPSNCEFPPGNHCLLITGNPMQGQQTGGPNGDGVYPIVVYITANVHHDLLGDFDAGSDSIDYYFINIDEDIGVAELLDASKFDVAQNMPNPSFGTTTITYTSPVSNEIDFKVYNMLGKLVDRKTLSAETGVNKYEYTTGTLAPGVYVYSMSNGEKVITKRMVVSRR